MAILGGGSQGAATAAGGGGGATGLADMSIHDFAKRATRFESSFDAADSAAAKNAVPVTILADKVGVGGSGGGWYGVGLGCVE